MKRIIAITLLLASCGAKPEPPKNNPPATPPKPSLPASTPLAETRPAASAPTSTESAPSSAPTSAPCPPDDGGTCLIERLGKDAFGPLSEGMPAKDVLALLKDPEKKSAIQEEGATGLWVQSWEYPKLGISLGMAASTKKGEPSINSITLSAPCAYKSKRGVGIGSTLAEVQSAYKDAMSPEDAAHKDPDGSVIAGSVYGGISFRLKAGKVDEIFMGAMAE